jgi:hypothetical protein
MWIGSRAVDTTLAHSGVVNRMNPYALGGFMAGKRWIDMEHEGHDITLKGGELATSQIQIHCLSRGYSCQSEGEGDSFCLLFPTSYSPGRMLKAATILEKYLRGQGYDINPDEAINEHLFNKTEPENITLQ